MKHQSDQCVALQKYQVSKVMNYNQLEFLNKFKTGALKPLKLPPLELNFQKLKTVFVDNITNDLDEIQSIVLFGSCANRKVNWRRLFNIPLIKYRVRPRDVDVLILTKNPHENSRIVTDVSYSERCYQDYHSYEVYRHFNNGLDVFVISKAEFEQSLRGYDPITLSIIKYGILLGGNFPFELENKKYFCADANAIINDVD